MTSQKIRLVLGRSKIPVGSSIRSPLLWPSHLRLKNEGYKKSEHQGVEGERLDQPDAEEHERPRLLERLRLAVDAGDRLADQVPHACTRTDGPRAGRDADPNKLKLLLEQQQRSYSLHNRHLPCSSPHSFLLLHRQPVLYPLSPLSSLLFSCSADNYSSPAVIANS